MEEKKREREMSGKRKTRQTISSRPMTMSGAIRANRASNETCVSGSSVCGRGYSTNGATCRSSTGKCSGRDSTLLWTRCARGNVTRGGDVQTQNAELPPRKTFEPERTGGGRIELAVGEERPGGLVGYAGERW